MIYTFQMFVTTTILLGMPATPSVQNLLSFHLLAKNSKIKSILSYNFAFCFIYMWNIKGRTTAEEVQE